jgi:hypothetical protein
MSTSEKVSKKKIFDFFFKLTSEPHHYQCSLCDAVIKQFVERGYSNAANHVKLTHSNYQQLLKSDDNKIVPNKAVSYYGWLDLFIGNNLLSE